MRAGAPGSSLLLLVLCSSVWSCSPSSRGEGGDTVTDRSESYPIVGSTARDLRWALDHLGPQNEEGERHDAVTRWRFEYTYDFDESARGCAVGALDLTAEIITVLPRWTADPGAPAELVTRWAAYVDCARLHEAGHRRIYLDALPQFRRRARTLAPRPTCDALTAALDALAHAWLEEIKELQVAYETRTDHGYIQCGRFP